MMILETRKRGEEYIKNNTSRNSARSRRRRGIKNAIVLLNLTTGDHCYVEFYSSHDKKINQFSTSKELMEIKLANNSTWHQSVQSPTNLPPMMSIHPIQQTTIQQPTQITEPQISPQAGNYTPSDTRHSTQTTPTKSQKTFAQMLECDDLELYQLLQEMTPTTKRKQDSNKNVNSEKCSICDDEYDLPDWIGCDFSKCKFWAHQLCAGLYTDCLLYTSPSPRDATLSRMPSSA